MSDMPWKEAIRNVLSSSQDAMHYSDIAEQIVELGLRKSVGATPANTVNAFIATSINEEGEKSPFMRVSRGVYNLNPILAQSIREAQQLESAVSENLNVQNKDTIINAFGMFWQRDLVLWSNNPQLLGRQQIGADPVDFSCQIGVYILYDGKETVYVGRSIDRTLGKRLFEHTQDRLNGRWNRFSWFGLHAVTDQGQLEEVMPTISTDLLVCTLEALLIEGLEPPQNRKRGDNFNASEYLQAIDPEIEKRKVKKTLSQLLEKYNIT